MPIKLSKKEVDTLLTKKATEKPTLFQKEIAELKSGEGLFIPASEWTLTTTITNYFRSKYKNHKTNPQDIIEVKKATNDGVEGHVIKRK